MLRILVLFITTSLLMSCSRNPVTGKRELSLMTEGQEISMGQSSDPSIVAQFGLYQDTKIQNFIQEKGKQMAAISHRPDLPYTFKVLDSPVVNAFALPGGPVYFTRGILAHFNNEAQFAGVLGHEIGHVTARHSAKQYSKGMLAQVGLMAGMIFSETFRTMGDAAGQAMGLLLLKNGRDAESESDMLGVTYSSKIGYDSHEMAGFFQTLSRLQEQSGQSIPTFLSTHPNPADRFNKVHEMSDVQQQVSNLPEYKINRNEYLRMIDGLVYGEDPRQGYTENYVFYHPELKFSFNYPSNWRLINSPQAVMIGDKDGKAMIQFTLGQGNSLDQVAQTEVQNAQLQVVESQRTNVNGFEAIAMISDQTTQGQQGQQGQTIRILSYFIQQGNFIYKFHGMSLKADFNRFYNSFESTFRSFSPLNDPSKLNVYPEKLDIYTVSTNQTLRDALLAGKIHSSRLDEFSILNGMKLTETVQAGTLIKVIEGGAMAKGTVSATRSNDSSSNANNVNGTKTTNTKTPKTTPTTKPAKRAKRVGGGN